MMNVGTIIHYSFYILNKIFDKGTPLILSVRENLINEEYIKAINLSENKIFLDVNIFLGMSM